jgi:ribosome-associated protein
MARAFKPVALALAKAISDKKGEEISLLHVGRTSPITDYLLIATALSGPHLQALDIEVEKVARTLSVSCLRRAKPESDEWRVLEFDGILVHLMTSKTRDFYAHENLYHEDARVSWDGERRPAKKGRPRSQRPSGNARAR